MQARIRNSALHGWQAFRARFYPHPPLSAYHVSALPAGPPVMTVAGGGWDDAAPNPEREGKGRPGAPGEGTDGSPQAGLSGNAAVRLNPYRRRERVGPFRVDAGNGVARASSAACPPGPVGRRTGGCKAAPQTSDERPSGRPSSRSDQWPDGFPGVATHTHSPCQHTHGRNGQQ